jgi:hypothetical protein
MDEFEDLSHTKALTNRPRRKADTDQVKASSGL